MDEKEKLRQILSQIAANEKRVAETGKQKLDLLKEKEKLEKSIPELKQKSKDAIMEYDKLVSEKHSEMLEITQDITKKKREKDEVDSSLVITIEEKENVAKDYRQKLEDLQGWISEKEQKIAALDVAIEHRKKTEESYKTNISSLRSVRAEYEKKNSEVLRWFERKRKEFIIEEKRYNEDIRALESSRNSTLQAIKDHDAENKILRTKVYDMRDEQTKLKESIIKLTEESEKLKEKKELLIEFEKAINKKKNALNKRDKSEAVKEFLNSK